MPNFGTEKARSDMTFWIIFIGNNLLLTKERQLPLQAESPVAVKEWTHMQVLPDMDGHQCRSFETDVTSFDNGKFVTVGLRESWNHLPSAHYVMAGKAAELLYWHQNTKYCGYCGAPTRWDTDISKKCTNCGKEMWPQVSPAIIVRVKRVFVESDGTEKERILLVNARNFRRSEMYGLVAGFVETGETLEECVLRELQEEVGIRITNLRYFGSQSWPYPSGIMLGFTADYDGGELKLQEEEIRRAGWFARDEMPQIPDKMSIARMLIDDFIDNI